jgi:hypothetical protein
MGSGNYKDELKRVRIAFIFSLVGSLLCLIIIFNSLHSNNTASRIITSAIGFSFIVIMTTIVFVKLTKLLKHIKRRR